MSTRIYTRLARLESLAQASDTVIGVRYINHWQKDSPEASGLVRISGTDEYVPLVEFRRRYPGARLITVEYVHDWRKDD